jgi:transposase-like protein
MLPLIAHNFFDAKSRLFRYFRTLSAIIRPAVMRYIRFLLSLRKVKNVLHKQGVKFIRKQPVIGGINFDHS